MSSVSVIIPTYNRINLLKMTLDQLKKLKAVNSGHIEVIVIDDESTDSTENEIKQSYSWVNYFKQEKKGASAARNFGVKKSNSKFIHFLDSDDLVENDFYAEKMTAFERFPEVHAVYGPFEFFNSSGCFDEQDIIPRLKSYPIEKIPENENILKRLLAGWYLHPSSIIWRKSAILSCEGYNENLPINQDVEFMFRFIVNGFKFIGVNGARSLVRIHQSSRVGEVKGSHEKILSIIKIRYLFKESLIENNLLNEVNKNALANDCYNLWVKYYKEFPKEVEALLAQANDLNPNLNVKGRWYFRLLGKLLGIELAVKIKDLIR